MSVASRTPHTAVAALAALALAACGGDEQPAQTTAPAVTGATSGGSPPPEAPAPPRDEPADDPADDRAAITATLTGVMTSADPGEVCEALVTERYVRDAFGDVRGCRRAQRDARPARGARVGRIVVLPESVAQAWVVPRGGLYDGERLRAELVLVDGAWKLDALKARVPVGP